MLSRAALKRNRSLRVVVERVDRAPDHERNEHTGETLPKELALISNREKEEPETMTKSGTHVAEQ